METRLGSLAGASAATESFDVNSSVIVLNLVQHDEEDVAALCQDLFRDVLGTNATVVKAERTRRRTDKPALIKCQLSNLEEKIEVLRCKKKVRETDDHKNVFIARMKTHEEHLIEGNFKSILKDLPNGGQYRLTGSGRLVDKRESAAPSDHLDHHDPDESGEAMASQRTPQGRDRNTPSGSRGNGNGTRGNGRPGRGGRTDGGIMNWDENRRSTRSRDRGDNQRGRGTQQRGRH